MNAIALPKNALSAPGPARMIEEIDDLLDHTTLGLYVAVVNREQIIVSLHHVDALTNAETDELLDQLGDAVQHRAIAIARFPSRFPEQKTREAAQEWVAQLGDHHSQVLDALLVSPTHWWSAMCHDEDCCPPAGRPRLAPRYPTLNRQTRQQLWDEWQRLMLCPQLLTDLKPTSTAVLVDGLIDLRLRDSILAHAGQNPDSRNAWRQLIIALLGDSNFSRNVALKTTLCALTYLEGDLKAARAIAEEALQIDGNYSLALLLHRGLVTKAPPGTLEAAFCNASIQELIGGEKLTA